MTHTIKSLKDNLNGLPVWLSEPLQTLYRELEENGEATTADETAAVIEAVFSLLGRLWVAEYLEAVAQDTRLVDPEVNRELFQRFSDERPMKLGNWVALARQIRERFVTLDKITVLADLAAVDFGNHGDEAHPVAQLLRFRNHFSHGSFDTTIAEIRQHRELLEELILRLPCLWKQPLAWCEAESGLVRRASEKWPEMAATFGVPAGQVAVLGDRTVLSLHPLLVVGQEGVVRRLHGGQAAELLTGLKANAAIAVWLARYERERMGHIEYPLATTRPCPETVAVFLRQALAARAGLVLVERRPGCGVGGAVDALTVEDPLQLGLQRYAALGRVAVRWGEVGQSGFSVAQMVLRLAERALGRTEGHYEATFRNLLSRDGLLDRAGVDLKAAGLEILLGIDGLEAGVAPYRDEPLTVRQVYESLTGTGITVVATLVTGVISRPLSDQRLLAQVEGEPDSEDLRSWVDRLGGCSDLHGRVLDVLAAAQEPMHLFEVCRALEDAGGSKCFEPEVERALWDLQPLLTWQRREVQVEDVMERVRMWQVFHPDMAAQRKKGK